MDRIPNHYSSQATQAGLQQHLEEATDGRMPEAYLFLRGAAARAPHSASSSLDENRQATRDQLYTAMALLTFMNKLPHELALLTLVCCIPSVRQQFLEGRYAPNAHTEAATQRMAAANEAKEILPGTVRAADA